MLVENGIMLALTFVLPWIGVYIVNSMKSGGNDMKRKAIQRRGLPYKVRYQPMNAGARWMVFWSGGGYSYFPARIPPPWVLSCICGADGIKYNDYVEWSVEK